MNKNHHAYVVMSRNMYRFMRHQVEGTADPLIHPAVSDTSPKAVLNLMEWDVLRGAYIAPHQAKSHPANWTYPHPALNDFLGTTGAEAP